MNNKLIKIQSDVSVISGSVILTREWANINKIHLIRPLTDNVTIFTGASKIEYPPTAFVSGGIYDITVHKIIYSNIDDSGAFIGITGKKI